MATQYPSFGDTPHTPDAASSPSAQAALHDAAGSAHDMAGHAKDAVQALGGQARTMIGDLHDQAKDKAGDLREQAMKYKDQALDQARSVAEEGKTKAADTIHGVADDLREAATRLGRNQTIAPVGRYANQAADALEDFAGTLRNKDVDQLLTEVSGFVRRNPAVAVGIAVAAGFALTQLLRGSTHGRSAFDDRVHA